MQWFRHFNKIVPTHMYKIWWFEYQKNGCKFIIELDRLATDWLARYHGTACFNLTLYHVGGGPHGPPLGVISCHSVGDAPTNPKFLDFSQLDPYFHLVKLIFIFFETSTKNMPSNFFFALKKNDFFTKMVKNIFFSQILEFFVSII